MVCASHVEIAMPSKLARSLQLTIQGQPLPVKTPLLIPSFSSKADRAIGVVLEALQSSITESFLVSAYDVSHRSLQIPLTAPSEVLFLDSGGYEASKDYDLMKPLYPNSPPQDWSLELFLEVLHDINTEMPIFVTAFDHPDIRRPISQQVVEALTIFDRFPRMGREFLVKPEAVEQRFVDIPNLIASLTTLQQFDIIGITEVELGGSILDRMASIAQLRCAMDDLDIVKPLHVFGSLDPVCTPLYFLAGADIFDGLSWLRFSYIQDLAVYQRNASPFQFGIAEEETRGRFRSINSNLLYLTELTSRLHHYLIERNEETLGRHSSFFNDCLANLRTKTQGEV